jgi:triosephosphate isomerase
MQRRTLIVGNWKMHKTIAQACDLVRALLADKTWQHPDVDVVVAPPFTALAAVGKELGKTEKPALAAQTMHYAEQGAFTGEISPVMLLEVGCRYVILGHSELRAYCGETDAAINLKVKSALAHGITPIIAVGETLEQHNAGRTKDIVTKQVLDAVGGLDADGRKRCVLAYEPIWAIGSGLSEEPAAANEVMGEMRETDAAFAGVPILYGGSMKPNNAAALIAQPEIDGGLVGGASLDAKTFAELICNARSAAVA